MKKAIIYYEKVWVYDIPMIKILGWKNVLTKSDLPKEYLEKSPYFYYDKYFDLIEIRDKEGVTSFSHGHLISLNNWELDVKTMKQAGERLHNILKKKKWQGKGKVII